MILADAIQKKNVPWSAIAPELLAALLPSHPIPSSEPIIHAVPASSFLEILSNLLKQIKNLVSKPMLSLYRDPTGKHNHLFCEIAGVRALWVQLCHLFLLAFRCLAIHCSFVLGWELEFLCVALW